jgi:hypothetical protein
MIISYETLEKALSHIPLDLLPLPDRYALFDAIDDLFQQEQKRANAGRGKFPWDHPGGIAAACAELRQRKPG